jgi:hypothetical protein
MYKVMVVVKGPLNNIYLPLTQQDKRSDADRDADVLKKLNENYKFAVVDEEQK